MVTAKNNYRSRTRHRFLRPVNLIGVANIMLLLLLVVCTSFRIDFKGKPGIIRLPGISNECSWNHFIGSMQDIYITRDQKVFFGPDELIDRAALLDTMAYGYDASFSDAEKERFMELRFIPVEPGNNQLKYWIGSIRKVKPKSRFYVYADRDTPYSSLKKILDALNEAGVPRISMVADTK